MVMTDIIGDMLTRIRNAGIAKHAFVKCPNSSERRSVLNILKREGFITDYYEEAVTDVISELVIILKYYNGRNVIKKIERVSRPGRRVYAKCKNIPSVYNGLGVCIVSTSVGVLSDADARGKNIGGEIICKVF